MNNSLILRLAWAIAAFAACLSAQDNKVAIEAGRIVIDGSTEVKDGILLVEQGRVKAVGPRDSIVVPAEYRRVDRRTRTVAPGLVDIGSHSGAPHDLAEQADAVDVISRAADVFDPEHRDFALMAKAGITSAIILPRPDAVVSGIGCIAKTAGPGRRMVEADGPIVLSLTPEAISSERYPTSFMGVRDVMSKSLSAAKADPKNNEVLGALVAGRRSGVLHARSEREIFAALELRREFGLRAALFGAEGIRDLVAAAKGTNLTVISAPLDLESEKPRFVRLSELEAAGIAVCFTAETPAKSPESLRLSAAIAARNGLSRKAALESITVVPAAVGGMAERIGSLAVGRDADFIVLDGDPLDLSAPIEETWIGGRRVAHADPMKESR